MPEYERCDLDARDYRPSLGGRLNALLRDKIVTIIADVRADVEALSPTDLDVADAALSLGIVPFARHGMVAAHSTSPRTLGLPFLCLLGCWSF